jgi:hypothetical protein
MEEDSSPIEVRDSSGVACADGQTAVVNCSHAVQEKKDEEQANEVKDHYLKTSEERLP